MQIGKKIVEEKKELAKQPGLAITKWHKTRELGH